MTLVPCDSDPDTNSWLTLGLVLGYSFCLVLWIICLTLFILLLTLTYGSVPASTPSHLFLRPNASVLLLPVLDYSEDLYLGIFGQQSPYFLIGVKSVAQGIS